MPDLQKAQIRLCKGLAAGKRGIFLLKFGSSDPFAKGGRIRERGIQLDSSFFICCFPFKATRSAYPCTGGRSYAIISENAYYMMAGAIRSQKLTAALLADYTIPRGALHAIISVKRCGYSIPLRFVS